MVSDDKLMDEEFDEENKDQEKAAHVEKADRLLDQFEEWLGKKGLKDKTISDHMFNMGFFIHQFYFRYYCYLEDETLKPEECYRGIAPFFGNYFIRKCMWSTEASMRQYAASIKKFYSFLYEIGEVDEEILKDVKAQFKEELPDWIAIVNRYNSGYMTESEMMDLWF